MEKDDVVKRFSLMVKTLEVHSVFLLQLISKYNNVHVHVHVLQ